MVAKASTNAVSRSSNLAAPSGVGFQQPQSSIVAASQVVTLSIIDGAPDNDAGTSSVSTVRQCPARRARCRATRSAHSGSSGRDGVVAR